MAVLGGGVDCKGAMIFYQGVKFLSVMVVLQEHTFVKLLGLYT